MRGYFAIGIENSKDVFNIGSLWRSAYLFGASYIFTINKRYKNQASDTVKAIRHIPLFHYETFEDFYKNIPYNCQLIGIELDDKSKDIIDFIHPERAIYLLGAEDHGLTKNAILHCHQLVKIATSFSLNVSNAGSIIMYDRIFKLRRNM